MKVKMFCNICGQVYDNKKRKKCNECKNTLSEVQELNCGTKRDFKEIYDFLNFKSKGEI